MTTGAAKQMTIDEADQTHDWDWIKHSELPLCKVCGMSKISAHIWGDSDWTRSPIPCLGQPADSKESK